jgi:diacylglycerol kinase (ATP)
VNNFSTVSTEFPAVVFVNPFAGGGRTRASLSRIRKLFAERGFCAEFVFTATTKELESQAKTALQRGSRMLLAMGGDGTFQGLVNAAYGNEVVLGVLPAGGGNDFALALGLPDDTVRAAEAILCSRPKCLDLVRAKTADARERLYVGGGGVGLDAEAARHASATFRRWPGRLRYVASALRALAGYRSPEVHVEFPGAELAGITTRALLAGVLNTPTYGAGIKAAPGARTDDGWLDVVVLKDLRLHQVLVLLPRLIHSGELRTPHLIRVQARTVRLTTDRPCLFHGDGEIFGPTPVEIEVVPRAVQVLAPIQQ